MDDEREEELQIQILKLELMFKRLILESKLQKLQQQIHQSSYKQIQLIEIQCCCPKGCNCINQARIRTWQHEECQNNFYLTDYGNVYCENCHNEFFIKYAEFDCENGIIQEAEQVQHEVDYCLEICGESLKHISTENNFSQRMNIIVERYMIE